MDHARTLAQHDRLARPEFTVIPPVEWPAKFRTTTLAAIPEHAATPANAKRRMGGDSLR
jgi:hypothetical protein